MNGEPAGSSELIWKSGQPNKDGGNEGCVCVNGDLTHSTAGLANDDRCTTRHIELYEKKLYLFKTNTNRNSQDSALWDKDVQPLEICKKHIL